MCCPASLLPIQPADALEARKDDLVDGGCRNTGKPRHAMSDEEFPPIIEHLRFLAAAARDLRGLAGGSFLSGFDSTVAPPPPTLRNPFGSLASWASGPGVAYHEDRKSSPFRSGIWLPSDYGTSS
jgi:hypothetical protein